MITKIGKEEVNEEYENRYDFTPFLAHMAGGTGLGALIGGRARGIDGAVTGATLGLLGGATAGLAHSLIKGKKPKLTYRERIVTDDNDPSKKKKFIEVDDAFRKGNLPKVVYCI